MAARARFLLLALAMVAGLLSSGSSSRANEEPTRPLLDLSEATVLASPRTPTALRSFLPRSEAPRPLRLPLPEGPLLILGLPETDPVAYQLATALGLMEASTDLHGGWRLHAWQDGERAIAVLLAGHPSSLFAAREVFEPVRAPRMMAGPRTLDYTAPDEQAGVAVREGTQEDIPHWRNRAAFVNTGSIADIMRLVGARASHAIVGTGRSSRSPAVARGLARLASYGIELVEGNPVTDPSALPHGSLTTGPRAARELPLADPRLVKTELPREWAVISTSPNALANLTAAWSGVIDETPLERMRALMPARSASARTDAERLAAALERAAEETIDFHPWMRARARHIRDHLAREGLSWLHVSYVPSSIVLDGRAGESAWRHATRIEPPAELPALDVRCVATRDGMAFAVRGQAPEGTRLNLGFLGCPTLERTREGWRMERLGPVRPPGVRSSAQGSAFELLFADAPPLPQALPGATLECELGLDDRRGTPVRLLVWR